MTIAAIDFNRLHCHHLAAAGFRRKTPEAWDARVKKVERRLAQGDYVDAFIARMDLSGCDSLLDVGCGSGALCLPLAARLKRVIALDYSPGMLGALRESARIQGIANVDARRCAWEDDWGDVPECDIAIASRSTQVEDLAAALAKLHAKARRRVYLTHRVGGHAVDPDILPAIGRRQLPPPDYIYVLNLLHGMDIHPRVDYLEGGDPAAVAGFDALLRRVEWSLGALDADETGRLREWHDRRGQAPVVIPARRWAFVSWEKAQR